MAMFEVSKVIQNWVNEVDAPALVVVENNIVYICTNRPGWFIGTTKSRQCYIDKYKSLLLDLGIKDIIIKEAFGIFNPKNPILSVNNLFTN